MEKEKIKELLANPAKLEEGLKKSFAEMDKENKGWVTFDVVHHSLHKALEQYGKVIQEHEHKEGELENAQKICDPKGTGKVDFEGFKALIVASLKHSLEH
jgi:Ca2+-binding EF-hand superfamily protein